ncbi:MAG: putative transrane protein [Caulobacteraceae bacterium]|nr:putative transrane protein [Caulobacteraceae bacterium]
MALLRPVTAVAAAFAVASGVTLNARAADAPLEYAVKANYLFKFAPFVEWPEAAFSGPASPFNICVVGRDRFGAALDQATKGGMVGEHPVAVRRYPAPVEDMACHILYVSPPDKQTAADILKKVPHQSVLTVTDGKGGMIQFVTQDGKIRFDVDAAAIQASGLVVSSKLLSLAVSYRRAEP